MNHIGFKIIANHFSFSANPEIVEKFVLAPDKGFAVSPLALLIGVAAKFFCSEILDF